MAKKNFFQKGYRDCIHWVGKFFGYVSTPYPAQIDVKVSYPPVGQISRLAYSASELASWATIPVEQVQIMDMFDQNGEYITTVWAAIDGEEVLWVKVGTQKVFASTTEEYKFLPSHCFRLKVADTSAVCCVIKGEVLVTSLLQVREYPVYKEEILKLNIFPCKFAKLVNYLAN